MIADANDEAWQATCSSLSPKSNHKSVYPLLRSVAGSSSSSSSFLNFPKCSSHRESALVIADYQISYFSVSQPKALHSRTRDYLFKLRQATRLEDSHSSICFPFSPAEFLAAVCNLLSSIATGPDKVSYSMLKHHPRLAWIFSCPFSIFPGLCIPFLPSGKRLLLFPSIRWESLSTFPLASGLSLSFPESQNFLNTSFYRVCSSFWSLILSSLPARPVSGLDGLFLFKFQILFLSQSISNWFNKPRPGSRKIFATINCFKAFNSVWHPALSHKLFSAGLPPCFARWTQSSHFDRRACVVFQNHKSRSFRVR